MMKLKATQMEFEIKGRSGYSFRVTATKEDRGGWGATVTMSARGYVSPEDAVARLVGTAEEFVRIATKSIPKGGA